MKTETMTVAMMPVDCLIPYARNPRKNDSAVDAVAASIKEFGFRQPIVVDDELVILVGHTRTKAAKKLGLVEVPVHVASGLTESHKKAYRIADNRLNELAEWDDDLLALELEDLRMDDFDLGTMGFDDGEIDGILAGLDATPDGLTDEDDAPEPPAVPVSKLGDVWLLGQHRLMCGDSAKKADVAHLMGGYKASLMVTDPPYGVAYVGKTKDALTVENDDCDADTLKQFVTDWFDCADSVLADGAYVLATVPAGPLHLIFAGDWLDRSWLRQIMVWNKDSMVLGRSEYHYKHEPILFGWKPGKRLANSDRTKTTVWDFARPKRSAEHPTMKPVEMWRYAIEQHSAGGGLLYEPFSGSGTSILAAEQTGRRCHAMELSPQYVDVAVTRWQQFTGKQATLEATGEVFPLTPPQP